MTITDEQVMDIASRAILASSDYDTKYKQWNKLPPDQRTWFVWNTTFCDANLTRIQADSVSGKSGQPFGEFDGAAAQQLTPLDTTPPR